MVVLLEGSPIAIEELQAASFKKSLGGSKLLPFQYDGGHCVLRNLKCYRNDLVPFPRSMPRHNPVSELYGQLV